MAESLPTRDGERGVALVSALLLLMLMMALTGALVISGQTETLVARNHRSAAQARAAAEAGMSHAAQIVIANLAQWQTGGFYSTSQLAISALLRGPDDLAGSVATDLDNGSFTTIPAAGLTLNGLTGVRYQARLMDEDDPARGTIPTNIAAAPINENNLPYVDANRAVLIRSTGYASDNTVVTLEAVVAPVTVPALVVNGDLLINGNPNITGTAGSVHANDNLQVTGNPTIEFNATATGDFDTIGMPNIGGLAEGGLPPIAIPPVNAADHLSEADFILGSDGFLRNAATGTAICDGSINGAGGCAGNGWGFDATTGWNANNNLPPGTYYAQTDVSLSSNVGSAGAPIALTIIAEGSISVPGHPYVVPDAGELLFVTDEDLRVTGAFDCVAPAAGQILVHEQMDLGGTVNLNGQILVEDAASVSTLVTANTISGTVDINYDNVFETTIFGLQSWWEVR